MDFETRLRAGRPLLWTNPHYAPAADPAAMRDTEAAVEGWDALAPLLTALWPELCDHGGIRSPLFDLTAQAREFGIDAGRIGRLLVKGDHALPVAGSIKARGALFEVLSVAVSQARDAGLLQPGESTAALATGDARAFFAERRISVGSTGNLGLGVGMAARALGYAATVHMSSDAKPWKVDRLRDLGVEVVRHAADYTAAVDAARRIAAADPHTHFVDDEGSALLFAGYSAAAVELAGQLRDLELAVGRDHPLILYLPCGIGGAPGGIAYGARGRFGPHVHPFFVEPVQAPSALIQMRHGPGRQTSVRDVGLTNRTEADGMAVATMSRLVADRMRTRLAGVLTVCDDDLFRWLAAADEAGLRLEPSAASGFGGPAMLAATAEGRAFLDRHRIDPARAIHVVWATGGALVPPARHREFLDRGRRLRSNKERHT